MIRPNHQNQTLIVENAHDRKQELRATGHDLRDGGLVALLQGLTSIGALFGALQEPVCDAAGRRRIAKTVANNAEKMRAVGIDVRGATAWAAARCTPATCA